MELVRCFGGIMDGKLVKLGERTEEFREPLLVPMPLAVGLPDSAPCIVTSRTQLYRLRTVHCEGQEVLYYAPEEWSDLRALRRALG